MKMRNVVKSSPVLAVLAVAVAYPWAVIMLPVIVIGLIRNTGGMVMFLALLVGIILAVMIVFPRLFRFITGCQRAWARIVFEGWKVIEMKRTVNQAEKRMRQSAVQDSRPVRDLGDESSDA